MSISQGSTQKINRNTDEVRLSTVAAMGLTSDPVTADTDAASIAAAYGIDPARFANSSVARLFGGEPDDYSDAPGSAATEEWIEDLIRSKNPIAPYVERVKWTAEKAGSAAHHRQKAADRLTALVLVATFAAAVLAAIVAATERAELAIAAAVLSALVGAITTWGQSTRWSKLASASHRLAVELDAELTYFQFGAGPYRPEVGGQDGRALIERCEDLTRAAQLGDQEKA